MEDKEISKLMHKCLIELREYGNCKEYHEMLKKELRKGKDKRR